MLAFILCSALLIGCIELIHYRWNKKRDAQAAADAYEGIVYEVEENEEFMDKTDFQQRGFR